MVQPATVLIEDTVPEEISKIMSDHRIGVPIVDKKGKMETRIAYSWEI